MTDEFTYPADHVIYRSGSPRVASSGISYGHGLCTILWIKVKDSEWAGDAEPGNSRHQRRIDRDAGPSPGETVTTHYPAEQKGRGWTLFVNGSALRRRAKRGDRIVANNIAAGRAGPQH
ncbi:MAG: hypothetical protein ACRDTA_09265 [Pseudonocardiaceae bacterium]